MALSKVFEANGAHRARQHAAVP